MMFERTQSDPAARSAAIEAISPSMVAEAMQTPIRNIAAYLNNSKRRKFIDGTPLLIGSLELAGYHVRASNSRVEN